MRDGHNDSANTTLEPSQRVIDSPTTSLTESSRDSVDFGSHTIYDGLDKAKEHGNSDSEHGDYGTHEADTLLSSARTDTATDALPVDDDERPAQASALQANASNKAADGAKQSISWSQLPRKDQLVILTLARLSEPLTQTSLQSYMFYQLRSFAPDAPDATISYQAGLLQAAFTGAQFCTAIMWGRLADSERMGRKKVILVGLLGTTIGCLGFGFSSSFAMAFFWRMLGGALNGNVGVMRTMISEIIREKKYQSRAFLLLPMTFNIGVIVGPIMGGLLADPISSYPSVFGKDSIFGGRGGVSWMKTYPYALPNLVSAVFLAFSAMALMVGLEETLESLRDKPDFGIRFRDWLLRTISRRRSGHAYQAVRLDSSHGDDDGEIEMQRSPIRPPPPRQRQKLPFRRLWTRNVIAVLIAHAFLACHVGTFNNLWFVFLSTPRYNPSPPANSTTDPNASLHLPPDYHPHGLFTFTGGLALPPPRIGTALAILGVIGISLQLLVYPTVSFKLGTSRSYRFSLCLFPLAYTLAPFLAIIPSFARPPHPASGPWFWMYTTLVLLVQVLARTFALPATTILVNNASPHPSVLGTIHGIGQSVSSAMRCFGPVIGGYLYGVGLRMGVVGLAWWIMAVWAAVGALAALRVREGDGHEIWLEGEKEEERLQEEYERDHEDEREYERSRRKQEEGSRS